MRWWQVPRSKMWGKDQTDIAHLHSQPLGCHPLVPTDVSRSLMSRQRTRIQFLRHLIRAGLGLGRCQTPMTRSHHPRLDSTQWRHMRAKRWFLRSLKWPQGQDGGHVASECGDLRSRERSARGSDGRRDRSRGLLSGRRDSLPKSNATPAFFGGNYWTFCGTRHWCETVNKDRIWQFSLVFKLEILCFFSIKSWEVKRAGQITNLKNFILTGIFKTITREGVGGFSLATQKCSRTGWTGG